MCLFLFASHFCTTYLLYCLYPFSAGFVQQKLWSFSSLGCHLLPVLHWLSCFCYVEYAQEEMRGLLNMNCCNKQSAEHLKQLVKSASVWEGMECQVRISFFLGVTKHCTFNLDGGKQGSSDKTCVWKHLVYFMYRIPVLYWLLASKTLLMQLVKAAFNLSLGIRAWIKVSGACDELVSLPLATVWRRQIRNRAHHVEGRFQIFTDTAFLQLPLKKSNGLAAVFQDVTWEICGL